MSTLILADTDAARYAQSAVAARTVEDACLDVATARGWTGPVVVKTLDGRVLFGITPQRTGVQP